MTAPLKFRAWDGRQMIHDGDHWNGETRQNDVPSLVYPVSVTNKGIYWCKKLGKTLPGDIVRDDQGNEGYTRWEFDRCAGDVELMPATGMLDRNGRLIYEHDIVQIFTHRLDDQLHPAFLRLIQWREASNHVGWNFGTGRGDAYKDGRLQYVEVIGNRWENTELMQQLEEKAR